VDPQEQQLDLESLIYDYAVTELPLHPVHENGKCNPDMMEKLGVYLVKENTYEQ